MARTFKSPGFDAARAARREEEARVVELVAEMLQLGSRYVIDDEGGVRNYVADQVGHRVVIRREDGAEYVVTVQKVQSAFVD